MYNQEEPTFYSPPPLVEVAVAMDQCHAPPLFVQFLFGLSPMTPKNPDPDPDRIFIQNKQPQNLHYFIITYL